MPRDHALGPTHTDLCRKLDLTLPSEAQWEYAARGGTDTPWWSGEQAELLSEVANLADLSYKMGGGPSDQMTESWNDGSYGPSLVGRHAPNSFGLHDVHGNAWEWCLDWYADYLLTAKTLVDPAYLEDPGSAFRVYRGGSFAATSQLARSAIRHSGSPSLVDDALGVRPARRVLP